jgi:hypothetical protein
MTETEELGNDDVAELLAAAARWAENQPWALTPGQVRGQRRHVTSRRRRRPPILRGKVISLVAAALVVIGCLWSL